MSKLKRAFTILMCILLTLPMCLVSKPNNVYAQTISIEDCLVEKTYNGFSNKSIGTHPYASTTVSCSTSGRSDNFYVGRDTQWVQFSVGYGGSSGGWGVYKQDGTLVYNGAAGSRTLDVSGWDKDYYYVSAWASGTATYYVEYYFDNGIPYYAASGGVSVSCSTITTYKADKPKFNANSYVQSNGNLTTQKMS